MDQKESLDTFRDLPISAEEAHALLLDYIKARGLMPDVIKYIEEKAKAQKQDKDYEQFCHRLVTRIGINVHLPSEAALQIERIAPFSSFPMRHCFAEGSPEHRRWLEDLMRTHGLITAPIAK